MSIRTQRLPPPQGLEARRPAPRDAEAHLAADLVEQCDHVAQAPSVSSSAVVRPWLQRNCASGSLETAVFLALAEGKAVQHVLLDLDVAEGDADAQDVELVLGRREGEQHGKHIVDPL
jgi:hypothetical protein